MTPSTLLRALPRPPAPDALPPLLAAVVGRLPSRPPSMAFAAAANALAWPALRELDWSIARDRRFHVRVRDLGLSLYFGVRADGFYAVAGRRADVTFTASAADFARLALRLEDPDTLFFNRRLLIEGDTDLGLAVKNLLDGVELEVAAATLPAGLSRVLLRLRRLALETGAA